MLKFLKQFVLNPWRTGAILPSSPELANAMMEPIDFEKAKHIVELGPGTGVITRGLLKRMRPDAKLTAVEICHDFCKDLSKIKDSRLAILHADAKHLSEFVKEADYVVSGLPLISLPKEDHRQILREIRKVTKEKYIQFHYSPLGERQLKKQFSKITKKMAVKNIPPAIVYTARP